MRYISVFYLIWMAGALNAQNTPVFGPIIPVQILGYNADLMEPFLSIDGNALIFNNLNDGVNTSLHLAARVSDSVFQYVGALPHVNQAVSPRLDAVASMDSFNNFFWVSTRDYPAQFDNLHRITFQDTSAYNMARVRGDFYVYSPGWIIMDAAIHPFGKELYYCNAFFGGCPNNLPCWAQLGIANYVNDSTFNKNPASEAILTHVNDTNYIIYAPQVTADGLELYFTRALRSTTQTELCVSVRNDSSQFFGVPTVLDSTFNQVPEGPTLSQDKQKLYYHKKAANGQYKLYLRYRQSPTSPYKHPTTDNLVRIYPNPNSGKLYIEIKMPQVTKVDLNMWGDNGSLALRSKLDPSQEINLLDISHLSPGTYIVQLRVDGDFLHPYKLIVRK